MLEYMLFFIFFLFIVIVFAIVALTISIIKDIDRTISEKNKYYDKYFKNSYEEIEW